GVEPRAKKLFAINAALVLSADHELNPATFVARIAASGEADLHSCIIAAIGTNSGARIARGCDRIETVLRDASAPSEISTRLRKGWAAPDIVTWGSTLPIYPAGAPRGQCLLDIVRALPSPTPHLRQLLGLVDTAEREFNLPPRLETALVLLSIALCIPKGA